MWLGELITARGIGNGMSLIIFISIVSRLPSGAAKLFTHEPWLPIVLFMVIALAVVVGVICDHHRRAAHPGAVRQAGGRAHA